MFNTYQSLNTDTETTSGATPLFLVLSNDQPEYTQWLSDFEKGVLWGSPNYAGKCSCAGIPLKTLTLRR